MKSRRRRGDRLLRGLKNHRLMFVSCCMAYNLFMEDGKIGETEFGVDDVGEHSHWKHVIEIIEID
jgi:hypothetical protein